MESDKDKKCDETHIQKIQKGDKIIFARIFRTYYTDLFYFIKRYVGNPEVCENIIQDLFLNIWLNREKWRPKGKIRDYLFRSARNRAFDYLSHQKVVKNYIEQQLLIRDTEWEAYISTHNVPFSYEERTMDAELVKTIQKGIAKLPERRRLILSLSWDEGLTYKEIAEVLDISVKTVETQMGRALKHIREFVSKNVPAFLILAGCFPF